MKLRMLKPGMEIQVEYFTGNPLLPGFGRYHTVKGDVAFFDPSVGLRIGDTEIEIRDICEMSGDVLKYWKCPVRGISAEIYGTVRRVGAG